LSTPRSRVGLHAIRHKSIDYFRFEKKFFTAIN